MADIKPPMDPHEWSAQEMNALNRFMKAVKETRDALVGVEETIDTADPEMIAQFADQLIGMRDWYWPEYQEMTLQNLRRQVY